MECRRLGGRNDVDAHPSVDSMKPTMATSLQIYSINLRHSKSIGDIYVMVIDLAVRRYKAIAGDTFDLGSGCSSNMGSPQAILGALDIRLGD